MKKLSIVTLILLLISFEGNAISFKRQVLNAISFKRQVLPVAVLITLPMLDGFVKAVYDCRNISGYEENDKTFEHTAQKIFKGAVYGTILSMFYLKLDSLTRK